MSLKKSLATFAAVLLLSPDALAVVVINPVPVFTNMESFPGSDIGALTEVFGLTPIYESGDDYQNYVDSMPKHSLPAAGNSWVSVQPTGFTGFIDFDLPEEFVLRNIAIWSGFAPDPSSPFSSLNAFEVLIDGVSVLSTNAMNAVNPENDSIFVQSFDLKLAPATSLVQLQVLSNHANGNLTAISEVAFGGTTSSIPEPTTAVLLSLSLLGFGFRKIRLK